MKVLMVLFLAVLVLWPSVIRAEYMKCVDGQGRISITNAKCPEGTTPQGGFQGTNITAYRVAKVLSILPRQEGTLLEIRYEDAGREQMIIHLASKTAEISVGQMVEVVPKTGDQYSFYIRHWPRHQGAEYLGSIPRPEGTK